MRDTMIVMILAIILGMYLIATFGTFHYTFDGIPHTFQLR